MDFYHYRIDVYTHFQHTFMFKQLEKWILHPMTPLSLKAGERLMTRILLLQWDLRSRVSWSRWIWPPPSHWVWGYPSPRTAWAIWFQLCLRSYHSENSCASCRSTDTSSAASYRTAIPPSTRVSSHVQYKANAYNSILTEPWSVHKPFKHK